MEMTNEAVFLPSLLGVNVLHAMLLLFYLEQPFAVLFSLFVEYGDTICWFYCNFSI